MLDKGWLCGTGQSCRAVEGCPPLLSQVLRPDMMVIAPRRNEGCLGAVHLLQFEAQHIAIEFKGAGNVSHFQMNVTNPRSGRNWGDLT